MWYCLNNDMWRRKYMEKIASAGRQRTPTCDVTILYYCVKRLYVPCIIILNQKKYVQP